MSAIKNLILGKCDQIIQETIIYPTQEEVAELCDSLQN